MTEKSVLIIDTDRESIDKIKSALESEGYLVFISSNKETGLAAASEITPSLIFISISIGATSGLEISKAIHETKALAHIPIVVITPHGATIESRYTIVYGIVDFIKKPFTAEEVISKTIDILEMKQIETHPREVNQISKTAYDGLFEEKLTETELAEEVKEEPPRLTSEDFVPVQSVSGLSSTDDIEDEKESKIEDIDESIFEEFHSEKSEIDRTPPMEEKGLDDKTTVKVAEEQKTDSGRSSENFLHESTSDKAQQKKIRILPVSFIALAVIGIISGGFFVYTSYIQKPAVQQDTSLKPAQPIQQQVTKNDQTYEKPISPQLPEKTQPSPPPPEQKDKTADKQMFSVQIGVFKSETNAKTLSQKYKEKGHNVFIDKIVLKDKGIMYKVLIGQFKNQKEATAFAKNLYEKEKINIMVVKR